MLSDTFYINLNLFREVYNNTEYVNVHLREKKKAWFGQSLRQGMESEGNVFLAEIENYWFLSCTDLKLLDMKF